MKRRPDRYDLMEWLIIIVLALAAAALASSLFGCARPDTVRPHNTLDGIDVQYEIGEKFDV